MTADQIIEEISILPPAEQAKVIHFASRISTGHQLDGSALSALAGQLAANTDPAQLARLRAELTRGFYGSEPHA